MTSTPICWVLFFLHWQLWKAATTATSFTPMYSYSWSFSWDLHIFNALSPALQDTFPS